MIPTRNDERPIVCGTDFSPMAAEATDVAAAIARRAGVRLILLHVQEFRGLAMSDPTLFDAVVSRNRAELARESARLRNTGTIVEEKVFAGSVYQEFVKAATESQARLIVVGAVGHGAGHRFLVGSVAERVAQTSPVPTLVTRPGSALSAWLDGERRLKVLVGYDFSAASDSALRWVRELCAFGRCEINATHVNWPPQEARRVGYHGELPLTENPDEIRELLERDVRERIAMILPRDNATTTIVPGWGRTDGYLLQIASRDNFDLIVVGTNSRRGVDRLRFGSVSRGVLNNAAVSVAVVPTSADDLRASRIPKITRVLAATDFSNTANEAVRYACGIVEPGGTLKVIHVAASGSNVANAELVAEVRALVPEAGADLFEIDAQIVASNDPAEAIAHEAERFAADVICVGSHGLTGLSKALLGSVVEGVMTRSRRPVLVVRLAQ